MPKLTSAYFEGYRPNSHQHGSDYHCGDDRSMAHPLLLSMHNVWVREHNRIADGLRRAFERRAGDNYGKDRNGDDEFIFQASLRS